MLNAFEKRTGYIENVRRLGLMKGHSTIYNQTIVPKICNLNDTRKLQTTCELKLDKMP